jgi:1,4-dihydroxy-2-naphthoyl-CoA hydrolase
VTDHPLADAAARLEAGEELTLDDVALPAGGFDREGVGLVWDTFSLERVTAHLDCGPRHHQPFGLVHGGVWCSVVETVASIGGALRVAASGQLTVGVSNTTDFLRAHREGRVDAVGTPVHTGRTQQLWLVELSRASDGKAVARGQVRLQNIDAARMGGATP